MIFQLAITVSCSRLNQQQTLLCQTPFIMPSFCCWEGLPNNAFTHICHGSHCGTWKSLRDWHQPRSAFTIGGKEWATFLLWTRAPISSLEIRMGYSPARLCWEQSLLGTFAGNIREFLLILWPGLPFLHAAFCFISSCLWLAPKQTIDFVLSHSITEEPNLMPLRMQLLFKSGYF